MSDAIEQADSVKEALDRYSGWVAWADELHKTEPKTIAWPYDGMGDDSAKIARAVARDRIGFILSLLPGPEWELTDICYQWKTSIGLYSVTISGNWCRFAGDKNWNPCDSLESGQAACLADRDRRVAELFDLGRKENASGSD